ncbi:MarR family winged helix-turn-helix transcriptional regulator [Actibacterium pelagium]|uniref:Transcriptional regulator n=1 Tax=Actibacterium pelagium TaxID=2029103 RepID=A0A917ELC9_9RHOB|nr:MarR family transcriptional regulator [Actibacterium pelagium]GGE57171.1 transcriptional regulator [Actibacterium pelagium]
MKSNDFNLSHFLPYRLAVLSERVSKRLSSEYSEQFGLTTPEWRVMAHLSRSEKVSVREIHTNANLEKPRVSRAVAKLEKAGLVTKSVNEGDHRLIEVSLTPEGWKVLNQFLPNALELENSLLGTFSSEEVDQFYDMIERLHAVLDEDPKAAPRPKMDKV